MATEPQQTTDSTAADTGGTRVRALILWVLVAVALLFGVIATAVKIPALFS